ncbi:MAG: dicarboxylate/amino acid:cation symporter [Oscillospiraceae bacterium]|jgi:Na+/H+-dicarboxylate symporter|nr:dicarboxylate/amino acid:cation symporter [Oscillospiraceae bacterium]
MSKTKKLSLATWIFIGLAAGIIVGFMLMGNTEIADGYIKPFGTLFLNLLKLIVVPIVLFSITAGVISMKDIRKVGAIGWKTIVYYMCTTAAAVVIGLVAASLFKGAFPMLSTSGLEYEAAQAPSILTTLIGIFPDNPIAPLLNANMLQVIVIALLLGIGIILAGEKGAVSSGVVESLNEVFLKIMTIIIRLSPIGVFCLIVPVVATNGPGILGSLALVLLAAYVCYFLHAAIVYSSTVKIMAGVSPVAFFKGMFPAMMMAFSSASSVGTLPLNLECSEKLGARKDIASFVLPLGATVNMDGTAIYQGLCSVFIASCFGIDLTFAQMLTIVLTATLASIGTAGVPGAGMIMLAMVLQSVGLPVEGIALVAGVDRIFDMGRTTINITGDAACAIIVTKLEEKREARQKVTATR